MVDLRLVRRATRFLVAGSVLVGVLGACGFGGSSAAALAALEPAAATLQRVFYLAPDGSDSGPGTKARPWRSLQRALDRLDPGETLLVREGTYTDWVVIRRSGTAQERITVAAYPGERPVVRGRLRITGAYVTVRGFEFLGGGPTNDREVLVYVDGGDHFRLSGSELTGSARSAIFLGSGADDARILRNWIHHNGTHDDYDHGIYWAEGSGGRIANNLIEENRAFGIQIYPDADGIVVANNTILGNGRSAIIVGGEPGQAAERIVVANNLLVGNEEYGIRSYWGGRVGEGNLVTSNLAYSNGAGDFAEGFFGEGLAYEGNVTADPRFRGAGDPRLAADSPAVGRALADYAPPRDLAGKRRDAAPDLGAYES